MPLSSEKIPNDPLTGPELVTFILRILEKAMRSEWAFQAGSSYPRVGFSATLKFHFASVSMPAVNPIIRIESPLESAPLRDVPEGTDDSVLALQIEKTVENPNLERVHAGLPITVLTKQGAMPGKMFPTVERHEVTYDPKDYPPVDPPTIKDITAETAAEWNIKLPEPPADGVELSVEATVVEDPPVHTPKRRGRPPKNA